MNHDLWHHGDKDLAPGLIDFAVNVRQPHTPAWLVDAITRRADWAAYPDLEPARQAIAAHHGVDSAMVLPTAGAAEAFTLIARAILGPSLIVHPQFTEPEAALLAANRTPARHLLEPAGERPFTLDPAVVPAADLIVVGNPTNPTGVLHARQHLTALDARVLVVDEAFMDTIPGEPESLIAPEMPGRLVLRSLTKTWALAGIRVGYVVGEPSLIRDLARQQPPWSVSTPAVAATIACLAPEAQTEARRLAREGSAARADLAERLADAGFAVVWGEAPFVLVDIAPVLGPEAEAPRRRLAELGFAVRRGDTFPGLGPTWLRLSARSPELHARLVDALVQACS